jgi:DNA mismatch repair protein MutS2
MKKTMRILEFEKIREQLQKFTLTVPGAQKVAAMHPLTSIEEIAARQRETSEAAGIILQKNINFAGSSDLMPLFTRAERGGLLGPSELKEVEKFLRALESLKSYFLKESEMEERFPLIFKLVQGMQIFPHLTLELEKCLTQGGEIKDSASSLLSSLRSEERSLQGKIRQTLESYLRTPHYQKYLQENIITMRHDRYVLPVKQEYRRQIPGVVHDQSASGVTLFIEPLPVLELNNRLRGIKGRIEDEIEKILRRLTTLISNHYHAIISSYEAYGELDYILARGRLSVLHKAGEPSLNDRGIIVISKGRHPLLPPEEVVPVDVHLGRDFNTLVITGPNTGGKTVTLKTIGLFILMAQCGLHIPAAKETDLGVFEGVWADIGDEQNIEQSLSTFSGHMLNIIEILSKATSSSSLVLLDELGAGTDPSEGSALAMAILEELHSRGVRTVATTHINDLKVFAHLKEGMENASMEFDPLTLRPSFKLLIGVPGQSNALNVAERLGMPRELTARARSYMRKEFLDLQEAVSGLVEERHRLSADHEKVKELKIELEILSAEITAEKEALKQRRAEMLRKAREEAAEIVRGTRRKTDEILHRLNRAEKENTLAEALVLGQEARQDLKEIQEEIQPLDQESGEGVPLELEEAKEGQEVYIKSLRCRGTIVRVLSAGEIQIQAGTLRVSTVLDDLYKWENNQNEPGKNLRVPVKKGQPYGDLLWEKSAAVSRRLDLRGLTLDEAIFRVEKHMDDSILANLDKIEIIHGKGTGKLRSGLHHYLQSKEQVESFRLGLEGEGGSGVTIVKLKKM